MDIKYMSSLTNLYLFFPVENEANKTESAQDLSCRKRVECIVPATVVPIGCAIIVTATVLAIKKPFSE